MRIDALIEVLTAGVGEQHKPHLSELLTVSVGRVMERDPTRGREGGVAPQTITQLNHIRDWLLSAIVNDEHWLQRKDANGVPLKLSKFGKLEQIVAEADKAMRRNLSKGVRGHTSGVVAHSFEDGWAIVRLTTPEELDAESSMMQHCVGHGSYDDLVTSGHTSIFSLRDPFGKSHVTINCTNPTENDGYVVEEISGKQNSPPRIDYFAKVLQWIQKNSYKVDDDASLPNGYAVDISGSVKCLHEFKDGDHFSGDIKIYVEDAEESHLDWLKRDITIGGCLSITGVHDTARQGQFFRRIGDINVKVDRLSLINVVVESANLNSNNIYISSCLVKKLPAQIGEGISFSACNFDLSSGVEFSRHTTIEGCNESQMSNLLRWSKFAGNVEISRSKLKIGKGGLKVDGRLALSNLTAEIEGPLQVDGFLALNRVVFPRQPYSLWVKSSCDIHMCSVPGLPDATFIGGDLSITEGDGISSIRRSWDLRGGLILRRSAIERIEKTRIFGELHLSDNKKLKCLPPGLHVTKSLYIAYQNMPIENLQAHKLELGWDAPQDIGENVVVSDVEIRNPKRTKLPDGFVVGGDLTIAPDCDVDFGSSTVVGGSLLATGSRLRELPDDLHVIDLDVSSSSLSVLPEGLKVAGNLDASNTAVNSIPCDLEVDGWANFSDTNVASIPSGANIRGEVTLGDAPRPIARKY